MPPTLLAALILILSAAWVDAQDKEKKEKKVTVQSELKKLQGTWSMVKQESDGQENAQADRHGLVIAGTDYIFTRDSKPAGRTSKIRLNVKKDPREIDILIGGDQKHLGIYRFNEDGELEICMNQPQGKNSDKRPTNFATKPGVGNGSILYVLKKREKK
jgi:uncharacterized protein (TIGR03067 family)